MYPLLVSDLFGIGKKTVPKLEKLNIKTIEDLANFDPVELSKYFKNQAIKMINSAKGINNDPVKNIKDERKCLSNETTLEHDFTDKKEIIYILSQIASNLAQILRKEEKYCNVVEVHLKDNMFKTISHQKKLDNATNLTSEIFNASKELLDEMYNNEPIRLIGIRLDKLVNKSNHQVSLFEEIVIRDSDIKLEKTIDELQDKFGSNIIKTASLKNKKINKKY
jgi:DNA polymerase-4